MVARRSIAMTGPSSRDSQEEEKKKFRDNEFHLMTPPNEGKRAIDSPHGIFRRSFSKDFKNMQAHFFAAVG